MATEGGQSFDVNKELGSLRDRWGLPQTPYVAAAFGLFLAALLLGSLGHTLYLIADDFDGQVDGGSLFNFATGMAVASVAMMALLRWQHPKTGGGSRDDLRIVAGIGGLSVLWTLLAFYFGFLDDRLDPQDSWFRYSELFAFLAMAWCVISRPIPSSLGTTSTVTAAMIALGVAAVCFIVGFVMAGSDDFSTFTKGVTLQDLGKVIAIWVLAAFLGLSPKSSAAPPSAPR